MKYLHVTQNFQITIPKLCRHFSVHSPGAGDHPLKHWQVVWSQYPSTARISNILAVEKKLIKRVKQGLRDVLGL